MAYFEIDVVRESILIQINIPRFDFGESKITKFYCMPSPIAIFYIFGEVDNMICNFTSGVITMPSPLRNYLGWTNIIGHDVIDMGRKELLS